MIARSLEGSMLRLAVVVLLVSGCVGAVTAQQQVRGQVINRDGAPQQCQVNFYVARQALLRVDHGLQRLFRSDEPRANHLSRRGRPGEPAPGVRYRRSSTRMECALRRWSFRGSSRRTLDGLPSVSGVALTEAIRGHLVGLTKELHSRAPIQACRGGAAEGSQAGTSRRSARPEPLRRLIPSRPRSRTA